MQDLFLFEGCGACYSRFQRDYFREFFPQFFLSLPVEVLKKKSQQIIINEIVDLEFEVGYKP